MSDPTTRRKLNSWRDRLVCSLAVWVFTTIATPEYRKRVHHILVRGMQP